MSMEPEQNPILLRTETERYVITFQQHASHAAPILRVRSKLGGGHSADYTQAHVVDEDGRVLRPCPIDMEVARIIMDNFARKGDTEAFNIPLRQLEAAERHPAEADTLATTPESIRHTLTDAERSFTSTGAKLLAHKPVFYKFAATGMGSVIRATLTNHQVCSSRCPYCSTISRNKKDSVSFEEAKAFVDKLYFDQAEYNRTRFPEYNAAYKALTGSDIRLRGLILSGGGQPNLWPHFEQLVEYLATLDIDLGLITNGFPQKVNEDIYRHFTWVRISITPENASAFYPNGRFDLQYLPATIRHNPDTTVGYSYVYGPWTDDDIFHRIHASMADNGFDYCRLLTDCNLTREAQLRAHHNLAERLHRLGYIDAQGNPIARFFHQLKYHGTQAEADGLWDEGQCFLQTYNVFWDTTGHEANGYSWCYPCDSVTVLAEEADDGNVSISERRFNPTKWGTVKNSEVERLFTEPVRPYFDPRKNCTACLFMRNNQTAKQLIRGELQGTVDLARIQHVNFP